MFITSKLLFSELILNSDFFFVLKFPGAGAGGGEKHNDPEISSVQKE